MRPVRLEVEGFATFRSRTVLDFDDLDLVAFVGPTGAGKSTIIDAITFALYGSVSRYDDIRAVAPVIHQLANEAKVRFDFELAGQRYTVVRVVRRRGGRTRTADATTGVRTGPGVGADRAASGATTKEARIELLAGPEEPVGPSGNQVLAGSVGELDDTVQDLLGLDFHQFTRTVVLPQGQFARFLTDKPSDRQKLLTRLLDLDIYTKMAKAARESSKVAAHQAEALEAELERQDAIDDERLAELRMEVTTLTGLQQVTTAELAELAGIDDALGPLRDRVREADAERDALEAVEVPDDLGRSEAALVEANEAVAAGTADLVSARTARDDVQAAIAAIGDRSRLVDGLARFERLADARDGLTKARGQLTALRAESDGAEAAVSTARIDVEQARAALSEARRAADAAVWTARLVEGEPCPVCHQTVDEVPEHPHGGDEGDAERAVAEAERQLAAATTALSKLSGTMQATESRVAELEASIAELEAAVGGDDQAVLLEQRAELARLDEQASAALAAVGDAEANLEKLAERRRRLAAVVDGWSERFAGQRDAVSHLKPPPPGRESLRADWIALADWAAERRSQLAAEREDLATRGKDLARRRSELLQRLTDAVEPHGIDPDPVGLASAVAVARSQAEGRVAAAEERRAEQARLRARVDELIAERELNKALGRHLGAGGFEGWLLNEALDNIVARATRWLRDLSGGAYSLVASNREFAVIDHHNADERRDVRTLSGGETFLTSLSLALALADSIAELAPVDAPRLESMFLDEGFGTLDAATLDVVAGAIEDLASSGRMIGIVTHVRDLAERMPARFEVAKTPTGSTVELIEI